MSADQNRNHDMSQTDIALLLADAADEVEIGIAPVQAVIRGGRRRRARRWAVATVTALVVAGSTGALAVTGLPGGNGGHGDRGAVVATRPPTAEERHVYEPQRTELARGTYRGKEWRAAVELWGAPRDQAEAARQFRAMDKLGLEPAEVHKPADLIGKVSFFVTRAYGDHRPQQVMFNTVSKLEKYSGTDLEAVATRLGYEPESSGRLVIGMVATTAQQVKCTWKDGTSIVDLPRRAAGFPMSWFVCVAPEGTSYRSAEVIQ
ncbi:hypothetical protein [Streptomyces sp. Ag109_G2-15]|uniref:hypothetical protein n=1 Tax=Streptomyces sp. Ag109_G2-15 TaxID=1938850 RepID=UPI000BCB3899|nr:hypothetical protein [Streptomyces sp. Ag109_G2-15]SOD86970.1 hypothetical protein SAMN06272765_4448 [Streptomyces sp. Ag109_G2-15]